MVLSDYATTGDGLVAALQVLATIVEEGRPASKVCNVFQPLPQLLRSVRYRGGDPLETAPVQAAIADAEGELAGRGRLLIRKSGTEPVIRVMAEGDDEGRITKLVGHLCKVIADAAKAEAVVVA